ncbi:DUF3392 domain-containing protein [Shewanella sp. YIC-542]|uniref:DUF3392 domain-containing protein n=1 Tax=Shewanella mytili TaxID=3377111 RepID=UPI00398EF07C
MHYLVEYLTKLGTMLYPWLGEIASAMVACLVFTFGVDVNRWLRRRLGARGFIMRTLIFILLNAFGYGLLIVLASPWLARQMAHMPALWLLLLVVATFMVVGVWAQRNQQS